LATPQALYNQHCHGSEMFLYLLMTVSKLMITQAVRIPVMPQLFTAVFVAWRRFY
jgi:hypothetical protein